MLVEDFRGALRIVEWPHGSGQERGAAADDERLVDAA